MLLGEEETADQDFIDAHNTCTSAFSLAETNKQNPPSQTAAAELCSKSSPYADLGAFKQLKHSALKLPKMSLPVFDGDRRKWPSFWDVFKSAVHDVKDISNVTKFSCQRRCIQYGSGLKVSW